jgi:gamma-glutamyl phosphate reductase
LYDALINVDIQRTELQNNRKEMSNKQHQSSGQDCHHTQPRKKCKHVQQSDNNCKTRHSPNLRQIPNPATIMSDSRSLVEAAQAARAASLVLAAADVEIKNKALACIREQLIKDKAKVTAANVQDKEAASSNKLDAALLARLDLEGAKYDTLLSGVDSVIKVEDPVGRVSLARQLADGLDLFRVSCPIGVLCIIFESRPEAALQISSLAIKSGNAVILKGGKEAIHSNTVLVETIRAGLALAGLPADCVQLVSVLSVMSLHDSNF